MEAPPNWSQKYAFQACVEIAAMLVTQKDSWLFTGDRAAPVSSGPQVPWLAPTMPWILLLDGAKPLLPLR